MHAIPICCVLLLYIPWHGKSFGAQLHCRLGCKAVARPVGVTVGASLIQVAVATCVLLACLCPALVSGTPQAQEGPDDFFPPSPAWSLRYGELDQFIPFCDVLLKETVARCILRAVAGLACRNHELEQLQLICAQFLCVMHIAEVDRWTCMSSSRAANTTCGMPPRRVFALPCGFGARRSLASLSDVANSTPACFHMRKSFYEDIDAQVRALLSDIVEKDARDFLPDEGFAAFVHQLNVWQNQLCHLRFLFTLGENPRSPFTPVGTAWHWPQFRSPPWRAGRERPAPALARVAAMVCEALGHRVAFVEVGVFTAGTSAELVSEAGGALREVHLVDPWDTNREMRAQLAQLDMSKATPGEAILAEVWEKMQSLPGVVVDDGYELDGMPVTATEHDPSEFGSTCHTSVAQDLPIFVHRGTSAGVAGKFAPGSIDLVFIDGGHTFEEVFSDLIQWWPRLRPGGVLAGHDFSLEHPGVLQGVVAFFNLAAVMGLDPTGPHLHLDVDTVYWTVKPPTS